VQEGADEACAPTETESVVRTSNAERARMTLPGERWFARNIQVGHGKLAIRFLAPVDCTERQLASIRTVDEVAMDTNQRLA
jgi:hypothetical protein